MREIVAMSMCIFSFGSLSAPVKDLGVHGHTYPIAERSLLEVIHEKLSHAEKSVKLKELQQQFMRRAKKSLRSPKAFVSLPHAHETKEYLFDPTYTQKEEVRDHEGRIIVASGTKVNPLEYVSWGEPIVLIDGNDPEQVAWALQHAGKIVLVSGKPLDLYENHKRWFYFDQGGIIVRRFGIKALPSVISQEGVQLKIKEIVI